MVVVGSVHEKNKIIKDPDQEIYARHFDRSLIRKLSLPRFAQAAHQACCEPVKITAKFHGSGSFILLFCFSHIHGRLFKPPRCVCYTLLAINFCIYERRFIIFPIMLCRL